MNKLHYFIILIILALSSGVLAGNKSVDTLIDNLGITLTIIDSDMFIARTINKNIEISNGTIVFLGTTQTDLVKLHEIGHIVNNHVATRHKLAINLITECVKNYSLDTCKVSYRVDKSYIAMSIAHEKQADMYAFTHAKEYGMNSNICTVYKTMQTLTHNTTDIYHPSLASRYEACMNTLK
jgi:hypothetical protein